MKKKQLTQTVQVILYALFFPRHKNRSRIPPELQMAINSCNTEEELTELLFSLDFTKDEAIFKAFDKRYNQLETAA
jgi:hypothetical protein